MVLGKVKNLTISFDCLNDSNVPVYSSGDTVSGRVNLEVTGEIRVKSLKIHAEDMRKYAGRSLETPAPILPTRRTTPKK